MLEVHLQTADEVCRPVKVDSVGLVTALKLMKQMQFENNLQNNCNLIFRVKSKNDFLFQQASQSYMQNLL